MSLCHRELRLEDILADSIVRAVMEADGVDPRELEAELRQTAALLRATRRTRTRLASARSDLHAKCGIT
jgi:hypothetical protein